jgi:hypothetical protein
MSGEYEVISYEQLSDLNVFLVRMQERGTHLHPDMELGLVLDGAIVLERGGVRRTLRRGDLYLVNPLEAHCFTSAEEGGGILLIAQISARLVERVFGGAKNIRYACGISLRAAMARRSEELSALLTQLGMIFFARREGYEFRCLSCVGQIYYLLHTTLPWSFLDTAEEAPCRERADRMIAVLDYIEKNYTRKLLLGEIARREHLSLTYLSHLFKDVLGMSFQDYLRQKRFARARRLVAQTEQSILEISLCCGFSDVRYLTKLFREELGCSPMEYRKKKQVSDRRRPAPAECAEEFFSVADSLRLLGAYCATRAQTRRTMPRVRFTAALTRGAEQYVVHDAL